MLSTVDGVLLGVVALSALLGLFRGIVVEVLSLVVWIAGFWLAFRYGDTAAGLFAAQVQDPAARLLAAYAVVFIAAVVVGGVVTWLVGKLVRSVGLGGIDRLLGLVFGLVRGVVLACVVVLLMGLTTLPQQPAWQASPLVPELQSGAEWMRGWLPDAAARRVSFEAALPAQESASTDNDAPVKEDVPAVRNAPAGHGAPLQARPDAASHQDPPSQASPHQDSPHQVAPRKDLSHKATSHKATPQEASPGKASPRKATPQRRTQRKLG